MENPRPEKVAIVDEVRERMGSAGATLLTEYRGLNVAAMADLRRALRAAGGEFKIYKNTLVRLAAADLGVDIAGMLTGPTAVAFVDGDPVTVAKALRDFARTNPALVVKGGVLGETVLDEAGAKALAEVEPREVLLAKLAGAMAAPLQQFAGLLQALPRNLAYGLAALIEQQGGAPEAPAETEDTPAAEAENPEAAPAAEDTPAAEADDTEAAPAADDTPADQAEQTEAEASADDTEAPVADQTPADVAETQES